MKLSLHERTSRCRHDDEERCITGTWCTPEVREAVVRGYVVVKIYEVWHFTENQRRTGLFADYVNTWLKAKMEASGYPHWANTQEKKAQYVANYVRREGIRLDPSKIVKNPGRKATAKLMLNSFWGKFGENLRKSSTCQITSPAELYEMVTDPLKEVTTIRVCSEDVLEVVFKVDDGECVENGKTNLFVAAFTTCHARLKLYGYLHTLQQQVLYFDTDSVIYSHREGQPRLENGDFLGDLTNELSPGDTIQDFTSGGPKNYGYRTREGKVECKVRGFSLGSIRGHEQLNRPPRRTSRHSRGEPALFHKGSDHKTHASLAAHQGIRTRLRQAGGGRSNLQVLPLRIPLTLKKKQLARVTLIDRLMLNALKKKTLQS